MYLFLRGVWYKCESKGSIEIEYICLSDENNLLNVATPIM